MRVNRLYLENFIGIKDGTGRDIVDLNFPAGIPPITMFFGRNGSGKTSLLSQMHPGSDSYDVRQDIIVEGKEGKKILGLIDGDDVYEFTHHYRDGKVKSFFTKNDNELNPNGGVKNFASLLEEHLGFTPDFFKVGKIGSNVMNFVDMISSDRKKYISRFLPNVDPWLLAGKIVSKKFATLRKNIAFLSDELSKLDTADNLNETADSAEQLLNGKRERVTAIREKISSLETTLGALPDWAPVGKNPHSKTVRDANRTLDEAVSTKSGYLARFPSLEEIDVSGIDAKLATYSVDEIGHNERLAVIESETNAARERVDQLTVQLGKKKEEVKSFRKTNKDSAEIQEMIDEAQEEFDVSIQDLESFVLPPNSDGTTLAEISSAKGSIWSVYEMIRVAITEAGIEELKLIEDNTDEANLIDFIQRAKSMAERKRDRTRGDLDSRKSRFNLLKGQAEQAKAIDRRPAKCMIDNCQFITSAIRFKDAPQQLLDIQNEINISEREEKLADRELAIVTGALDLVHTLHQAWEQLSDISVVKMFPIGKYIETFGGFCDLCTDKMSTILSIFDVNSTMRSFQARDSHKAIGGKLETLRERLESSLSSNALVQSINSDIELMDTERNQLNDNIEELQTEMSRIVADSSKLRKKKEILVDLKENMARIDEATTILAESNTLFQQAEAVILSASEICNEIEENDSKLKIVEREIAPAQKLYDDARVKLARRQEYEDKIDELNSKFQIIKDIKESLDPVKGIPTLLIGDYLKDIEIKANNLLDVAYGGTFRIGFNITDSDFFIEVHKENGRSCQDVKLASQGQVAMIKTTLSLAIFESALGRYNILCLDEIDGGLDESNRRMFIDIIDSQIVELGLEQMFCISHNDSFDAANIGLILMPGHTIETTNTTLMRNKRIIADLTNGDPHGGQEDTA
jgi:recombinational DNA repair ATPase RecF